MKTNPNAPINPAYHNDGSVICDNEDKHWIESVNPFLGLTIREHFAAMAMQGKLSGMNCNTQFTTTQLTLIAEDSVQMADALINALNK